MMTEMRWDHLCQLAEALSHVRLHYLQANKWLTGVCVRCGCQRLLNLHLWSLKFWVKVCLNYDIWNICIFHYAVNKTKYSVLRLWLLSVDGSAWDIYWVSIDFLFHYWYCGCNYEEFCRELIMKINHTVPPPKKKQFWMTSYLIWLCNPAYRKMKI